MKHECQEQGVGVPDPVQGNAPIHHARAILHPRIGEWRRCVLPVLLFGAGLGLAGCSSGGSFDPLAWWHNLHGGAIAAQRPPPPGADQPYPNLASVPARPRPFSAVDRDRIAQGLAADRTNALFEAEQDPISASSVPKAAPKPAAEPAAAAGPEGSSASLAAVSSPQANQAAPSAPAASAAPAPAPRPAAKQRRETVRQSAGTTPDIPGTPPLPPEIPGVPIAATVPVQSPKAPPVVSHASLFNPAAARPEGVPFPSESAVLPPEATGVLTNLAHRRGPNDIVVTGFGGAVSGDVGVQGGAMVLGMQRAEAVAFALTRLGVPASAIRMEARPVGQGAAVRLVAPEARG